MSATNLAQDVSTSRLPTSQEIWKWTLTKDAIAPCFVEDVLTMKCNDVKNDDFLWLGRIPCRTVRIVGLVVGIQVYEKRIVYTVDDGTSVIDCFHRCSTLPASPKKPKVSSELAPTLVPVAFMGSPVCVVGRVTRWRDSRQINVDHIRRCSSNEEPSHWKTVLSLHKSYYSLPHPFYIPSSSIQATETQDQLAHHRNTCSSTATVLPSDLVRPETPSSCSSVGTTPTSSPLKPTSPQNVSRSPQRLRHPSRLHFRDLTANTFRIYVKHFMDNEQLNRKFVSPSASEVECDSESTPRRLPYSISRPPVTPTKCYHNSSNKTPQPLSLTAPDHTSRPASISRGKQMAANSQPLPNDLASGMVGYTLSYLRRVPELAAMARRVVQAEAKRRERAERQRAKENEQKEIPRHKFEPLSRERLAPKMKRLFKWAIVKLYEEGSIVLWEGPVRKTAICGRTSQLWKVNSSANTSARPDSTVLSSTSPIGTEEDDDATLSDPQPHEEAYVPVTAAYLAGHVEKAIATLMARSAKSDNSESLPSYAFSLPPGPTTEDIMKFMQRSDERWARLGSWAVGDTLEVLKREGKVWRVCGKWELCL